MTQRKKLVDKIPPVDRKLEEAFVYKQQPRPVEPPQPTGLRGSAERLPFSSRIRADLALALKRASLERQLQGVHPNSLQEMVEEALEPWLRTHGYLS